MANKAYNAAAVSPISPISRIGTPVVVTNFSLNPGGSLSPNH